MARSNFHNHRPGHPVRKQKVPCAASKQQMFLNRRQTKMTVKMDNKCVIIAAAFKKNSGVLSH